MTASRQYRFAFDIGGTFTDLVLAGSDGSVHTGKTLSGHSDVVAPIISGLRRVFEQHDVSPAQINTVIAGATTAVTNLIIERKGARTALITTRGFRDVIEIGRELRYDVYDLIASFPEPLVARELRAELSERIDAQGRVVEAPVDAEIEALLVNLQKSGAESIAVCLLHSYRNTMHEHRVRDIAAAVVPKMPVSLSSDILAELREYERTVATVLNAYVMPMVGKYLEQVEGGLKGVGIDATLRIMQSNGGVISRELGSRVPIRMLESGPAAGALGAAHAAQQACVASVLAFDMGGTTAKACLITNGKPELTNEFEAARMHRFKKGSGFPVRLPVVDLIEIGAGGGSIAYVDRLGLLKVGPRSAGSEPGPACYGRGGTEPTVTDAALMLGYIDPHGSLSGEVDLRSDLAEAAISLKIAKPLGMSPIDAAAGIHRIVCDHMASAANIHAVERGKDLRRYTLFAFGGAGPIHAREVARRLNCSEILIPANAGVFSALGLLVAPLKVDLVRTYYGHLRGLDWDVIERLFEDMAGRLATDLMAAGVEKHAIEYRRTGDLRYVGQGFEVTTDLPPRFSHLSEGEVAKSFHAAYASQFGHALHDQPIEALNWRLEARANVAWPEMRVERLGQGGGPRRSRPVYFSDVAGFVETEVLDQALLASDWRIGPAIVEQPGSAIVVGPGDRYRRHESGSIHILLANAQRKEAAQTFGAEAAP